MIIGRTVTSLIMYFKTSRDESTCSSWFKMSCGFIGRMVALADKYLILLILKKVRDIFLSIFIIFFSLNQVSQGKSEHPFHILDVYEILY